MSNVIGHPQPDRDERATQAQAIRNAAHSAPQRGQARTSHATNGPLLPAGACAEARPRRPDVGINKRFLTTHTKLSPKTVRKPEGPGPVLRLGPALLLLPC